VSIDWDPNALQKYLAQQFGVNSGDFAWERIAGGQSNPTFFIDYAGRRMVLRKQPSGPILRGAHAVDREFRVLEALSKTTVPVPKPIVFCADAAILGTPFYLMERLDGRVLADCALPGMTAEQRRGIYLGMAEAMAAMHAVRPDQIGLADYGRPGNYFERQFARWSKQYQESPSDRIPALDRIIDWLGANMPPDDGCVSIAHGDFRLGNMLFHPTEPRVIGILDWELSTLGHPLADLGFCCMPWWTAPEEFGGILGLDHAKMGIPAQDAFVAHYMAHAIPTPALQPFHVAFALFRFAVIFVGIADRARAGNAASSDAAEKAPLAGRFAVRALEVVEAAGR
jgi:aminoglycoside phosphotransferase (APT) family kinase protein